MTRSSVSRSPGTARSPGMARSARAGAWILAGLALLAAAAPLLAPYDPAQQLDAAESSRRPPLSSLLVVRTLAGEPRLAEDVHVDGDDLVLERRSGVERLPLSVVTNFGERGIAERRRAWLGTDALGRDLLSRLLHGARVSLTIGLLAAALALSAGTVIGSIAATCGRFVDQVLMRTVDGLLCFPHLALVLLLAALYQPGTWLLVVLIGGTGWMGLARLVRAEILRLRQEPFALAAAASGRSPAGVLVRHLLPNATTPLLIDASLRVGGSILVEAALSFLGLGVQPPQASWGSMIADGQGHLTTAWWIATFPGLMVAAAVIGSSLLADGLSDRLAGIRTTANRGARRRSPWAIRTWLGQT